MTKIKSSVSVRSSSPTVTVAVVLKMNRPSLVGSSEMLSGPVDRTPLSLVEVSRVAVSVNVKLSDLSVV